MSIFALQSPAGGFLDEDMEYFNREFDEWCVQFEHLEDALLISETLDEKRQVEVVEITPLSYPKYFFHNLHGNIHATRQLEDKIICIVEPTMGAHFRIAICDLKSKTVRLTQTRYKSAMSVEGTFSNFSVSHQSF